MTPRPSRSLPPSWSARLAFALLLVLGLVLGTERTASAAGTVQIANREPQESDGKWKLQMTINYGGTPHLQHIPMLFIFTPVVLYEQSLTDQSPNKPILTRIPLSNQPTINESMDVGFTDGSGKIFKTTKFDFLIRRDRGFEAGEYTLKIQRSDGVQVGTIQNVKLKGDNPVVDRRAIVFAGEKKKEKKAEGGDSASPGGSKDDSKPASADAPPANDAPPATDPTDPAADGTDPNAPPSVPPKQGGCGCRLADRDPGSGVALFFASALFVGASAARRKARRAPCTGVPHR